jgi:hypothetical protein
MVMRVQSQPRQAREDQKILRTDSNVVTPECFYRGSSRKSLDSR